MQYAEGLIDPLYSNIPFVSMDIKYGAQVPTGEVLDFDYEAYQIAANAIAKHTVTLRGVNILASPDHSNAGDYFYDDDSSKEKQIIVRAELDDLDSAQCNLLHETKHLVDDLAGKFHHRLPRRAIIAVGNTCTDIRVYGPLAVASTALLSAAAVLPHTTDMIETAEFRMGIGLGLATLGGIACYYLDPHEWRARKAESLVTPSVFRLTSADELAMRTHPLALA